MEEDFTEEEIEQEIEQEIDDWDDSEEESGDSEEETLDSYRAKAQEKARRGGWRPKDEYKGDPEDWRDELDFLDKSKDYQDSMRETIKALKKQDAKSKVIYENFKNFAEQTQLSMEKKYKNDIAALKSQKDEAIEEGDKDRVYEIEKEMDDLEKPSAGPDVEADTEPENTEIQGAAKAWAKSNPLYGKDDEATAFANDLFEEYRVKIEKGAMKPETFFKMVDREMGKVFEDRYPKKYRSPRNPVAGGRRTGAGPTKKKKEYTENDLSFEQKKVMGDFVNSIPGYTKEAYIKDLVAQGEL